MKSIDPKRMSTAEVLAELGELLAVGYRRRITSSMCRSEEDANSQKHLEASGDVEAKWSQPKETSK